MTLVVVGGATVLLERVETQAQSPSSNRDATSDALAKAKAALIAWAVTYPAQGNVDTTPGLLPFPDRNADGNYDGQSDCPAGAVSDADLLGRFPEAGQLDPANCHVVPLGIDVRDGSGERLWYAVSRNLLRGADAGPLNPDARDPGRVAHPWLTVSGPDGVPLQDPSTGTNLAIAAVIIAPGPPITGLGQNRTGAAPNPANYLDSIVITGNTYDNSDMDSCPDNAVAPCSDLGEEFVLIPNASPDDNFNDRIIYITVDELMRAVEKRVLGEAAIAMDSYRTAGWNALGTNPFPQGVYPWLSPFRNPWGLVSGGVTSVSAGQFQDFFANFITAGVAPGDIIVKINDPDDPLDDARGMVLSVDSSNTISYDGLYNSETATSELLAATDAYVILPGYGSVAGTREGSIPVHQRDQIFPSSFTATWTIDAGTGTFSCTDSTALNDCSLAPQYPPDGDLESG
ncbi:MAG: hypothetical protein R3286_11415, partial [Gammaproteobacteria bacterium]|nr:hypothetical protein [Gammaproteobacteria bacterium]